MNPNLSKLSAAVCIFTQLSSAAIPAFTPLISWAQNKPLAFSEINTTPYILKKDETAAVLAARYSISVDELKKLNVFRSFSKPFSQIGEGDEIDVPVTKKNEKDQSESPLTDSGSVWANRASVAGSTLSSAHPGEQAIGMAKGIATGAAVSSVEEWLALFGTVKAKINLDEDLNLDESSLDVLLPLYDRNNHLLFSQLGYRNKDSRNTVNAGVGFRTFQGKWMYGINSFYDDDVTCHNRRIGFGLEAWTDYLKLGANTYSGITDWHQSRDFADYDERPADGFDIRAEGWLPAYPQLGGKLVYEQYRGNEVALFSKDDRSDDPKAVTVGLNYTPVPLVTVGADHRQGQSGQNDTSINLEFNYQLGLPWNKQTDDSLIAARRTLAGSRLDLVDRNNDVVLEYKKQDLIRLTLPATLEGKAGNTGNINATVQAKYGVDHIDWDYSEILAAGGSAAIVNKQTLKVTYPPFSSTGTNVYHVSAVAYDAQKNKSNRETTEIHISEPEASIGAGDLTVTVDGAVADGKATDTVQAKVTDASHHPVFGVEVAFTADNATQVVTSSAVTDANGLATTNLTNTHAGKSNVTATVNGASQSTPVSFVADSGTATITDGNISVIHDQAKANTSEKNSVQAKVTDANGNTVSGATVTFSTTVSGATVVSSSVVTDEKGVASTDLTSTATGVVPVTATVNGASKSVDTHFVQDDSSASIGADDLVITTDNAKANGSETNAVKATVKDASGNPLEGVVVSFSAQNNAKIVNAKVATDKNGVAATTLTNTKAAIAAVTATVSNATGGSSQSKDTHFVPDSGTATITDGNLTVTTDKAKADGTATNAVKAVVTDANGNPVKDATVTFTATNGATVTTASATTDADGIAATTLTNTKSGVAAVTATVNGNSLSVDTTFVADSGTATITDGNLTVTTDNANADGVATDMVQAKVTDANGNLVPDIDVAFSVTTGATVVTVSDKTDAYGLAETSLTSEIAGAYTVTATITAKSQTATVNFKADATTAVTTLTSDVTTQSADGQTAIVLTAIVKDAKGNLVPNENVVFTTTGTAKMGDASTTTTVATDASGNAKVNLTDATVETVTVAAKSSSNTNDVGESLVLTFTAPPPVPMPSTTTILVNGATFASDQSFPKTGFVGAKFQIAVEGNAANNSKYTWSVKEGATWLSVDGSGNVTFNSEGSDAEIIAKPIGSGKTFGYTINVGSWFINNSVATVTQTAASEWCDSQGGGYITPDEKSMSNTINVGDPGERDGKSGQLWPEWGNMSVYGHGWLANWYWSSVQSVSSDRPDYFYLSNMANGMGGWEKKDNALGYTICKKTL